MILNKSPGLLWGAGGAMMALRLAEHRAGYKVTKLEPRDSIWLNPPHNCVRASAEFYRIIDRAEAAAANRETLLWANGHNTVRL